MSTGGNASVGDGIRANTPAAGAVADVAPGYIAAAADTATTNASNYDVKSMPSPAIKRTPLGTKEIGIEYLNIYGCSSFVDQRTLAIARNIDPDRAVSDFMIERRSLNPLFEDVITNAVNAAKPLLSLVDPEEIGLLVVGTESSVDYGKPISTNIHGALQLPTNMRSFETKHACYSGSAAMHTAIGWVSSGASRGRKALVISSDASRAHLNTREEFVMGGAAAAAIISDTPRMLTFETEKQGVWTTNVYDTYRPTSRHEMGNNELSLYTYLDALTGSYEEYCKIVPGVDMKTYFYANIFHTPFPGMAMQAHRTLYNLRNLNPKKEVRADFQKRVQPSLAIARLVGSTYGASNLAGFIGLLLNMHDIPPASRIGFFTYGSGAIGEFYSGLLGKEAYACIKKMDIEDQLHSRSEMEIAEYEEIEKKREELIDTREYTIDINEQSALYKKQYQGKNRYILTHVHDFQREYRWS